MLRRIFSLPEIGAMLDRLGLDFIGLQHADPTVAPRYRANFPDDATQTDLAGWDVFEERNPKAFAGMYHVWCRTPE
ncbi:MAG: hypothetical protein GY791_04395 [Alphaproteobacteria bacterium]|nr:hypothetical protein [Alphaproteobacteria bacterium]